MEFGAQNVKSLCDRMACLASPPPTTEVIHTVSFIDCLPPTVTTDVGPCASCCTWKAQLCRTCSHNRLNLILSHLIKLSCEITQIQSHLCTPLP